MSPKAREIASAIGLLSLPTFIAVGLFGGPGLKTIIEGDALFDSIALTGGIAAVVVFLVIVRHRQYKREARGWQQEPKWETPAKPAEYRSPVLSSRPYEEGQSFQGSKPEDSGEPIQNVNLTPESMNYQLSDLPQLIATLENARAKLRDALLKCSMRGEKSDLSNSLLVEAQDKLKAIEAYVSMCRGVFEDAKEHFEDALNSLEQARSAIPTAYYPLTLLCEAYLAEDASNREKKMNSAERASTSIAEPLPREIFNIISGKTGSVKALLDEEVRKLEKGVKTMHLMDFAEGMVKVNDEFLKDLRSMPDRRGEALRRLTDSLEEEEKEKRRLRRRNRFSD